MSAAEGEGAAAPFAWIPSGPIPGIVSTSTDKATQWLCPWSCSSRPPTTATWPFGGLAQAGGTVRQIAEDTGLGRTTVYRVLKSDGKAPEQEKQLLTDVRRLCAMPHCGGRLVQMAPGGLSGRRR